MSAACGSEKDLWSEQISKIAKRFLRFARSSFVFGGEAAELQPEFTLLTISRTILQLPSPVSEIILSNANSYG
jgi:hypothetical protein